LVKEFEPDIIFHLAGQVAMTTSIANPRLDFEVNALGTLNVLEAVREYRPECGILYSSTNKVFGDLEYLEYEETPTRYVVPSHSNGFDESTILDFHSPYGCSKGAADQYLLDFHRIFGLKTVVFRHSSMYGGRQFATYDQGWVGWFCQKAMEIKQGKLKEPFTISGNGKQVRDLLYASDTVNLYLSAAKKIDLLSGEMFCMGGGMENSSSLLELFNFLENELEIKMTYEKLPPRESDQKVFVADNRKAKRMIGWQPVVDKEAGIKKMIEWVKGQ
jgi:CDP-paratose 2-epimerase